MKRAAIIGLGDISPIHLGTIAQNSDIYLCAVCDIDGLARPKAPEGVMFFTDYKNMIEEEKPDCVHICLPHYLHYPVACDVVEMGCNVFCEKPVAISSEQAEQFAALESAHTELKLGVCLQNRLNETVEYLKNIIGSGEYGALIGARGIVPWFRPKEYYDTKPWRGSWKTSGSGVMMNQSIHTLDLLYYLCGPVKSLHASVSSILDYGIEVEDTVTARLEFASGIRGLFWATNANYANESVSLTFAFEKGVFTIENSVLSLRDTDGTVKTLCEDARLPGSKFYYGASHAKLISRFYAAIESGGENYIHVRDAVASIKLIDAILKSGETGKAVLLEE